MKRYGHLFEQFATYENLDLAERKARKGKGSRHEVRKFLEHRKERIDAILQQLIDGTFVPSKHKWKTVYDPKKRVIGVSPYYPDLIVQYALLNVLEPIWMRQMISTTYSCIKGRGIHACANTLRKHLKAFPEETTYFLQLDISKCYNNINHQVLEDKIRRKIKDERLLAVLFKIIEAESGLVIGDHIASWLCNIHLSCLDHRVKEIMKTRHYFRYADDIVVLADSKEYLWRVLDFIERELKSIGMRVKHNAHVRPVEAQGIDFIGYVFYHEHTLVRKRIKIHLLRKARKLAKKNLTIEEIKQELAGHWGWLKHCDSKNLQTKISKILGYENFFKSDARCIA